MQCPVHFQGLLVLSAHLNRYRAQIHLVSPSGQWTVRRRFAQLQTVTAILYQMRVIKVNQQITFMSSRSIRTITDEYKRPRHRTCESLEIRRVVLRDYFWHIDVGNRSMSCILNLKFGVFFSSILSFKVKKTAFS